MQHAQASAALWLSSAAERDDFVVLDADLAAATQTGMFKKAYPERFYDCGIAEADMIGIAAGIAATGKKVICSSFAMFAAGRALRAGKKLGRLPAP